MTKPVVVFGVSDFASLVRYVLTHDSSRSVAGFTIDAAYQRADCFEGLPVVPFEQVQERFPPTDFDVLVPLGGRRANTFRAERYLQAKAKGFDFATYVSSRATVWPDLQIGENSMVFEGAVIQPMARVGRNCIIRSQANVSHHATVGDHCFLAVQAAIGGGARVGERCFLGLGSTVRDGVSVAPGCVIGAGAVVIRETEENGVYTGVPAKRGPRNADELDNI